VGKAAEAEGDTLHTLDEVVDRLGGAVGEQTGEVEALLAPAVVFVICLGGDVTDQLLEIPVTLALFPLYGGVPTAPRLRRADPESGTPLNSVGRVRDTAAALSKRDARRPRLRQRAESP
jgi:hypothetical protein